jgi:hypothetical protein
LSCRIRAACVNSFGCKFGITRASSSSLFYPLKSNTVQVITPIARALPAQLLTIQIKTPKILTHQLAIHQAQGVHADWEPQTLSLASTENVFSSPSAQVGTTNNQNFCFSSRKRRMTSSRCGIYDKALVDERDGQGGARCDGSTTSTGACCCSCCSFFLILFF